MVGGKAHAQRARMSGEAQRRNQGQRLAVDARRNRLVRLDDELGRCPRLERAIDLATINGSVFVNNVSLGVYAEIVQSDEYRDDKVGTALRKLPDLLGPDAEPFDLHFAAPDGDEHATAHLLMISNGPYRLDRPFGMGTRPRLDWASRHRVGGHRRARAGGRVRRAGGRGPDRTVSGDGAPSSS